MRDLESFYFEEKHFRINYPWDKVSKYYASIGVHFEYTHHWDKDEEIYHNACNMAALSKTFKKKTMIVGGKRSSSGIVEKQKQNEEDAKEREEEARRLVQEAEKLLAEESQRKKEHEEQRKMEAKERMQQELADRSREEVAKELKKKEQEDQDIMNLEQDQAHENPSKPFVLSCDTLIGSQVPLVEIGLVPFIPSPKHVVASLDTIFFD